jgi:8-oxo-dGTP pyrophosphatase MutT (NUDIX family)
VAKTSDDLQDVQVIKAKDYREDTRNRRVLLARSPGFPEGMYSVLAGFVEPGESMEEAIGREVREEVGIEVAEHRPGHGFEHRRVHVRGTGAAEQPLGRAKLGESVVHPVRVPQRGHEYKLRVLRNT